MTSISIQERKLSWELGDLYKISPASLIRGDSDKVGRLILRLALGFNDLKDTIWLEVVRASFRVPAQNEVTPHSGQCGGIATHVHRYIGGILNEILKVIDDETSAINDHEFAALLTSLPAAIQALWAEIIAEARNSPESKHSSVRAMLAFLRNKSSFHYDGAQLRESFQKFFADSPTSTNQAAYYSPGVDMDGTRYYFADAAAQTDYKSAGEKRGLKTDKEVSDLARDVNNAFALLINSFLASRGGALDPP